MACIITTSTTVTITATAAVFGMAVIGLLALLASKELASAAEGPRFKLFNRHLNVAVMPLFIVFLSIVIIDVLGVL